MPKKVEDNEFSMNFFTSFQFFDLQAFFDKHFDSPQVILIIYKAILTTRNEFVGDSRRVFKVVLKADRVWETFRG